jgi:hypothetical protein
MNNFIGKIIRKTGRKILVNMIDQNMKNDDDDELETFLNVLNSGVFINIKKVKKGALNIAKSAILKNKKA